MHRPDRPRPTLAEIARRLKVSTATVSLALNGHPRVSAATLARVQDLARRLRYTPDLVARGLVTRRTGVVGLMVADIANSYFARLARRVEDAAARHGLGLVIASTDEDPDTERRVLSMMLQRRVDGLIVTSTATSARHLRTVEDAGIALVLLGRLPSGPRASAVSIDNRLGGYSVTRHLLGHGRTGVAVITGPRGLSDARGRYEGYAKALAAEGLGVVPSLVKEGDFSEASGYETMRALLRSRRKPDAVFVCNNLMLLGALRAIRQAGLRVPGDVAVAGFDEVEWSDLVEPAVTMAEQPTAAMARLAVELLLKRIQGNVVADRRVVDPVLKLRRSCGCPPPDMGPDEESRL